MALRSGVEHRVGSTGAHSVGNVTRALHGIDFPASKQELIHQAKLNHATEAALEDIEKLADHEYWCMDDVVMHYGRNR